MTTLRGFGFLTPEEKGIIVDEGFRSRLYDDGDGNMTYGIGFNVNAGINKRQAVVLMRETMRQIEEELRHKLSFFNALSSGRQYVLVNMGYNMGMKRFFEFKKMLAAMEEGNWKRARHELLDSKSARELPKRYGRLADIMESGIM